MGSREIWILNLHGIGPPPEWVRSDERKVWVDIDRFERLLDTFAGRQDVRITFDDGNASDVEVALPLLAERGLTATFFPCAGLLGVKGYCTPAQIRELADTGMTIGSHGWEHRPWRGLRGTSLMQELQDAQARLEDVTGRRIDQAACPFGAYDRHVLGKLAAAGFERVYTSDGGAAREDGWLRARNTILNHESADDVQRRLRARAMPGRPPVRRGPRRTWRWLRAARHRLPRARHRRWRGPWPGCRAWPSRHGR